MRLYVQNSLTFTVKKLSRKQLVKVKMFYFDWFLNVSFDMMPVWRAEMSFHWDLALLQSDYFSQEAGKQLEKRKQDFLAA